MMNPVDYCFSTYKNATKRELTARYNEICATDHLPWGQKMAARARILQSVMRNNVDVFTPQRVANTYGHVMSLMPACLAGEDIH